MGEDGNNERTNSLVPGDKGIEECWKWPGRHNVPMVDTYLNATQYGHMDKRTHTHYNNK